jgi:hypothetical protein
MLAAGPRIPLLAALLASLALACGCGSSSSSSGNGLASKPPDQILAAAKSAADGAASVHIVGSIVNEGKPIGLDLELLSGKGASGHLTLEGSTLEIVEVEHAFYVRGSSAFYNRIAGPAAAQLLQGKWLKAPASSGDFASFAQLTDLRTLIGSALASHGKLVSAGTTTINGQRAVGVRDTTQGGTLYVAANGPAYPLQVVKSGGKGGRIDFLRWNQPVTLKAPANAINISQLQSGH